MKILEEGNLENLREENGSAHWEIEVNNKEYDVHISKSYYEEYDAQNYHFSEEKAIIEDKDGEIVYEYETSSENGNTPIVSLYQSGKISNEFIDELKENIKSFSYPNEREFLAKEIEQKYNKDLDVGVLNYIEDPIERGQEYYNRIRNMNEELIEIGAKDNVSLDTEEFGMITGMEITNKELREFENNYNIENKITNLEKHIEEKFDKHFIEKEKQAENETPKKSKIKEIEEEIEH